MAIKIDFHLDIFYSDNPLSDKDLHDKNPIFVNIEKSRNGGIIKIITIFLELINHLPSMNMVMRLI